MTPKELRTSLQMSQAELAEKLGCSTVHVHHIEKGERTPSLALAQKYAELSEGKVTLSDFKTN